MLSYFKPRKFLDLSPHPYDIGNPFDFWHKYEDNHFLNKIYEVDEVEFEKYYDYHLKHTLEKKTCTDEYFFSKVWGIVEDRIKNLKAKDPFSSYHDRYLFRVEKLQQFQKYLNSIDQWNARPAHIVIAEKDEIIQTQENDLVKLQMRLDIFQEYEVAQKIRIEDDHLATVMDLIQQMRKLELPSGRKLLRSDHKSPYSKMVSKYFSHGGKNIPIETARNYFVEKKGDVPSKGTFTLPEQSLFKIIPVKEIKK